MSEQYEHLIRQMVYKRSGGYRGPLHDDLMQEGRLAAWKAVKEFNGHGEESGYVGWRVSHALVNYLRREIMTRAEYRKYREKGKDVRIMMSLDAAEHLAAPSIEKDVIAIDKLQKGLRARPPRHRRVLTHLLNDASWKEAAQREGISTSRVGQIHREFVLDMQNSLVSAPAFR